MKKLLSRVILLTLTAIMCGCGKDGASGSSYVAFDWDWYVDAYNDDNPSLPSSISQNFDYSTNAGQYNGEYACSDGTGDSWYWEFTYKIEINSGEDGKLFQSGDDGKDRYYKIFLNGLSNANISFTEKGINPPKKQVKKQLFRYYTKAKQEDKIYHGGEIVETFVQNNHLITLKRRMFTLK